MRRGRLRWLGHVLRMDEGKMPSRVQKWRLDGPKPMGRPKIRWNDIVGKDLQRAGMLLYGVTI